MSTIFYSITMLSMFVTLVLTIFFSITKKGRKTGNRIMVMLLILFGIQITYSFAFSNYAYQYFMNWHKTLFMLRQTALLIGPLIYLYLHASLKNRPLRLSNLFHAIPFVGVLIFLGFYYLKTDNFVIWDLSFKLYDTVQILLHNLVYIILSLITLRTYNYSIAGLFKNLKTSSRAGWFQFILFGFIVLWVVNLNSFATYMVIQKPLWCAYTGSIFTLALFLFLNSVMFLLLLKPEIYFIIEKYKKTSVNEDIKHKYRQTLIDFMDTKKPYLKPEITLEEVAKDMSVNSRILSQIINESFRNNFKCYINEFRIRESLRQLNDTGNKKTILEILFDSGFNSKSVFYTEFKKRTGLTPQEYRARCNKREMAC